MDHNRGPPKWGDSPGPLSPQGSQSGGRGDAAREEERKGGRAKDKLTGMKSIHETVPETQKGMHRNTGDTDKVELTIAQSGSGVYLRKKKKK